MQTRPLGRTGIEVSPLGLGTWALGGPFWSGDKPLGWGETDDAESLRVLHAAPDAGITLIDTADAYGTGHAERLVARAIAGRRDRMVIATKWGNTIAEEQRQLTGVDASPAYARTALDASLRRLDTDWVDLYLLHLADLPIAERRISSRCSRTWSTRARSARTAGRRTTPRASRPGRATAAAPERSSN